MVSYLLLILKHESFSSVLFAYQSPCCLAQPPPPDGNVTVLAIVEAIRLMAHYSCLVEACSYLSSPQFRTFQRPGVDLLLRLLTCSVICFYSQIHMFRVISFNLRVKQCLFFTDIQSKSSIYFFGKENYTPFNIFRSCLEALQNFTSCITVLRYFSLLFDCL